MGRTVKALVVFFAIILIFISGYKLVTIYLDYKAGDEVYSDVSDEYVEIVIDEGDSGDNTDSETEQEVAARTPISIDFEALKEVNPEVTAWLYLEDSKISYPVLHAEDNDKYLNMMIDGTYNKAGSIFMDYRNSGDFSDLNTIIYGHNMKNDSMFGSLSEYKKQEFYNGHNIMWLITDKNVYQLEIIAALDTLDDSQAYDIPDTNEELTEYLQWAVKRSDIVSNIDIDSVEQAVTLSTCYSSSYDRTRYIVVGKLTKVE